jgi:hypothetical protein
LAHREIKPVSFWSSFMSPTID